MKKTHVKSAARQKYDKMIKLRKIGLYAVLFAAFVIVIIRSTSVFVKNNEKRLEPQVARAVVQVANLLPKLEQNEAALRNAYTRMMESWNTVQKVGLLQDLSYTPDDTNTIEQLIDNALSWSNRVTRLKVGRDGYMIVVDKATGRIISHPDESIEGLDLYDFSEITEDEIVDLDTIGPKTKADDLDLPIVQIWPELDYYEEAPSVKRFLSYLDLALVCSVIDYNDTYIICGIPMTELLSYIFGNALLFSVFYLVMMWLLVKWICLVMNFKRDTAKTLRPRLISYSIIVCISLFALSLYTQILSDVTNDLKTMDKHAEVAVEMLNSYQEQRDSLNSSMDNLYGVQCMVTAKMVEREGRENLSRKDIQKIADDVGAKYVYVFDRDGNVIVTNSPYDRYKISEDPKDASFAFRALLEGVYGVIQNPTVDPFFNEYLQYVGISTRDENDICDGFVMIAVDPTVRDSLLSSLTVESVLNNLVIGLPDHAIAIDKDDMTIVATTGIGYKGDKIESLGFREENLTDSFSGFLKVDGVTYYAGVSESSELYLVPIVRRSGFFGSIITAAHLTLYAIVFCIIVILMTLYRYQKDVVDGAPMVKEDDSEMFEEVLATHPSGLIHIHEKQGIEERWHVHKIPKWEQTPEKRIGNIIYKLLLIFCLFILLPTLYVTMNKTNSILDLNNLAYILSGNWQKGLNIFALTSCIFLLCAMDVFVILLNRILYLIARVSSMRVETVCLLLKNAMKYICIVIFVYYGLSKFGVQTQTLLASAGILSLMISLGAKDLVGDIIAGFFIMLEGSYKVGDFVTVGSWYGTVVEIGLRTTRVRFFNETKIFNNSSMRDIINADGPVARKILLMPIGYDADLLEIEKVLKEELPKLENVIEGLVKPPTYDGVESFQDSSILLRITIFVNSENRYKAIRDLNREVKLIFDKHGINVPFNQIVVHEAKDKKV